MLSDNQQLSRNIETNTEQITSFVTRMGREYFADIPDRRSEPRYRLTVPVGIQPVDDDENVVGAYVRAVTRDLSPSGIGLICQNPLNGKLIVQLSNLDGNELCVLAQVLRCSANGFYFDVGCRFLGQI
jgi:hypothetical protein